MKIIQNGILYVIVFLFCFLKRRVFLRWYLGYVSSGGQCVWTTCG
jgi:hypothetical protein